MCHITDQLERLFIEDMLMTLKSQCPTQNQREIFFKYSTMCNVFHYGTWIWRLYPFLGTILTRCGGTLITEVYRKPTDTGLLLHFQSHVDNRYKKGLVNTMVNRAYRLSSTKEGFAKECNKLRTMFSKLRFPKTLVDSNINKFSQEPDKEIYTVLSADPFIYKSADHVSKYIYLFFGS